MYKIKELEDLCLKCLIDACIAATKSHDEDNHSHIINLFPMFNRLYQRNLFHVIDTSLMGILKDSLSKSEVISAILSNDHFCALPLQLFELFVKNILNVNKVVNQQQLWNSCMKWSKINKKYDTAHKIMLVKNSAYILFNLSLLFAFSVSRLRTEDTQPTH